MMKLLFLFYILLPAPEKPGNMKPGLSQLLFNDLYLFSHPALFRTDNNIVES